MRKEDDRLEYSDDELDVVNHLINGRNNNDIKSAKSSFEKAFNKSKSILSTSKIGRALYLESLSELADNEYEIKKRAALWNKLFSKAIDFLNLDPTNEETVIHCSDIIISFIKEPFISKDFHLIKKALSILKGKLDSIIKHKGISNSASILVTKASVLRNFSSYQTTPESQKSMLEEAFKCINKSISISDNTWYAFLELGNCYWRSSNFEKKLEDYNNKIMSAEAAYLQSQNIKLTIQNTLPLCNLYKETYQTAPFLLAFNRYELIEKNKRRFLHNTYQIAETSIRMFYIDYPTEILGEYLEKSDKLLNEAIAAGISDARIITDLAFIKAAKGEITVGVRILKSLKTSSIDSFDWNTIIEDIKTINESDDLFSKGFVLGIDDAAIWNKLGTFAITFLEDIDLGLKMYNVALHFNSKNPIVLTNIARTLLKTETSTGILEEAEYYLSRAESSSTFRFQWWRQVRADLEILKKEILNTEELAKPVKQSLNFSKISDLYKFYLSLKNSDNTQERGYDFEKLIATYFKLSLSNSIGSHRIIAATTEQIDAGFFFEKEYYRVEAKWTKNKTDDADVRHFSFNLKTAETRGLIISINGFTSSAIERARALKSEKMILLMDGDEIEITLKGSPTFDEAIRLKQMYFHYEDNPYYKISPNEQKI